MQIDNKTYNTSIWQGLNQVTKSFCQGSLGICKEGAHTLLEMFSQINAYENRQHEESESSLETREVEKIDLYEENIDFPYEREEIANAPNPLEAAYKIVWNMISEMNAHQIDVQKELKYALSPKQKKIIVAFQIYLLAAIAFELTVRESTTYQNCRGDVIPYEKEHLLPNPVKLLLNKPNQLSRCVLEEKLGETLTSLIWKYLFGPCGVFQKAVYYLAGEKCPKY